VIGQPDTKRVSWTITSHSCHDLPGPWFS